MLKCHDGCGNFHHTQEQRRMCEVRKELKQVMAELEKARDSLATQERILQELTRRL